MRRIDPVVTSRARALRRAATPEERRLWQMIARYRSAFTRQFPVGPYIVDFACREARLVVELDGSQHVESDRDRVRDACLERGGWHVLRFWNAEFRQNPEGVVEAIMAVAALRLGSDPPPAPPFQGGESKAVAISCANALGSAIITA